MAEANKKIRKGPVNYPFYGDGTLTGGTLTIQGTPDAKLYDFDGVEVDGALTTDTFVLGPAETVTTITSLDTTALDEGEYEIVFDFSALGSDGILYPFSPAFGFTLLSAQSAYLGIYPWIRSRLQDSVQTMEDEEFDLDIESALLALLAPYEQTYAEVTGNDRKYLNEAVGLAVACRLQVPLSTGGATTPLVLEKSDTASRQFAGITNQSDTLDERTKWGREARQAFARISFVSDVRKFSAFSIMGLAGRRRSQGQARDTVELAFGRLAPLLEIDF